MQAAVFNPVLASKIRATCKMVTVNPAQRKITAFSDLL